MHPSVRSAYEIALNDLRRCYGEKGIVAGRKSKRMHQYWARHGFFSSFGALCLNDDKIVKKNLELFASMQKESGVVPNRISLSLKPKYKLSVGSVIDSTALFVIVLAEYAKKTGDLAFLEKMFPKAGKAVSFLMSKDRNKDALIEERVFGNWAETVLKFGQVLYSNCCFYKALKEFAWLAGAAGYKKKQKGFEKIAEKTKQAINQVFWEGNYYIDWIDFRRHDFFSADGNLLAIDFGIADKAQSQMILNKVKQHQLNKVPLQTNWPLYPLWRIPPTLLPLLEYNYHNGFSWPWLGCLNAVCLNKVGWKNEAKQGLKKVAELINQNGIVHEVFGPEGKPVNGLFLKSERPFAWNAAFFVKAVHELGKRQ